MTMIIGEFEFFQLGFCREKIIRNKAGSSPDWTIGAVKAVNHLSLTVPAGIVFCFPGQNGAGKITPWAHC